MSLVSPYVGLVNDVTDLLVSPSDARQHLAVCSGEGVSGSAVGFERDVAIAGAVGEAAERYSATYLPAGGLRLAAASELGGQAVDPARFALFHRDQYESEDFKYKPFEADTRVRWLHGISLADCEPVFLPAQECLMADEIAEGEQRVTYPTTSGLALAATFEEAVLGGLLEAVERNAFMLTWHNELSMPRLDWSSDPEIVRQERRFFVPSGLEYAVMDLTVFSGIPTALAVVIGPPGDLVAVATGAASAPTISHAWRKALSEAFHTRSWLVRERGRRSLEDQPDGPADIANFDDHVLLYCRPEWGERAAFLRVSEERRGVGEVAALPGESVLEQIHAALDLLAARGATAFAADLTPPDIAGAGLRVAKVVVPELCSLYVEGQGRFLGGPRLYEEPGRLGLAHSSRCPADLNPNPHPFP
jgi:ribosomal protein S12 methylthiotransferase accessory factor